MFVGAVFTTGRLGLQENASSVRDPTAYVLTGIRKIEEGAETFSGGGGRQQRPGGSERRERWRSEDGGWRRDDG